MAQCLPSIPSFSWEENYVLCFSHADDTLNCIPLSTTSDTVFSPSCGWLFVFTDIPTGYSKQIAYLLNPVSGDRVQLLSLSPYVCVDGVVVLSASPADPDCMALIIDYTRAAPISVCRVHDHGEWIKIHVSWGDNTYGLSCSAVFCGGKFYCFCHRSFVVIDPLFPLPRAIKLEMDHAWRKLGGRSHYLVESNADVLLVVAMHGVIPVVRIKDFQVFRADFSWMLWVLVEALGDRVLFIDACPSFSLSTAEVDCKNFGPFY